MCIICAAIPATAAVGAKLHANQLDKAHEERKPIATITGLVICFLVITSALYHSLFRES